MAVAVPSVLSNSSTSTSTSTSLSSQSQKTTSPFVSSLRNYDSKITTSNSKTSSSSSSSASSSMKTDLKTSSSGSSSTLGHPLWSNRLINKGKTIMDSPYSSTSSSSSSSSPYRIRNKPSSEINFNKIDPGVGGLIPQKQASYSPPVVTSLNKQQSTRLSSLSSTSPLSNAGNEGSSTPAKSGQMQWWQKNKVWEKSSRNKLAS